MTNRKMLARFALLSISAAIVTIGLKAGAYFVTGSVGLLSDALESTVNLVAALVAFGALSYAARPPDNDHRYGHDKIEYFSSGIEGALILVAAISIAVTALYRLANLHEIEQVGWGVVISTAASGVNFFVARVLLNAGRRYQSITLEADARHLMTDVWTSVGVIIAVVAVGITGWAWLDPIIALGVAANIIISGVRLIRRSTLGLLDTALPLEEQAQIEQILDTYRREQGIQTHALLTRQAGARRFISMHVLVPNQWTVSKGHALVEQLERDIRHALPNSNVLTHLEPLEEPASFEDIDLDRELDLPEHV